MPVRFETSSYPGGVIYAHAEARCSPFASIVGCPLGWSIRWHHLEIGAPGSCEITETLGEAKALCVQFLAGLDIEPWH